MSDFRQIRRTRKLARHLAPWAAAVAADEMHGTMFGYVRSLELAFHNSNDPDFFEMTISAEVDVSTPEGLRTFEEIEEWEAAEAAT